MLRMFKPYRLPELTTFETTTKRLSALCGAGD